MVYEENIRGEAFGITNSIQSFDNVVGGAIGGVL